MWEARRRCGNSHWLSYALDQTLTCGSLGVLLVVFGFGWGFFWGWGGVLFFVLHVIKGSVQKVQAG